MHDAMRIGIDSYSYHRLLGDVRAGEDPPARRFERGSLDVLAHARSLGVDVVSLETVFLPRPADIDPAALLGAAGEAELVLAWGHRDGLVWGADGAALADLCSWLQVAPALGIRLVRLVVASPARVRPAGTAWLAPTVRAVREALDVARAAAVALCVENHADLTVDDVERLLDACPELGVCLDTANALRVGDDPLEAARRLRTRVRMVHLKDCLPGGTDMVAGPVSVPYGDGVVPVEDVLRVLDDRVRAGVPVCVELAQLPAGQVDERAMVRDAVDWLRAWRAGPGRELRVPAQGEITA